jgi:capsular exopolysaccharide synthesis family protein
MFRLLRTNLTYTNLKQKKQILLVTSSVSSEGKSVIAVNLGLTISLANKKVLILDLDLRKPRVAEYLNVDNKRGVTTFLIGEHTLDEVIQGYPDNENLFLISSGPIPPNPAELLLSDQIKVLMESVKERFDFVIIDSPPIGVVADALLLRDYITNMLLVVRHKQTRIAMLRQLEQMHKAGELISPSLVLNDIQGKRGFYGYSSYNYGYGKGYYSTDK